MAPDYTGRHRRRPDRHHHAFRVSHAIVDHPLALICWATLGYALVWIAFSDQVLGASFHAPGAQYMAFIAYWGLLALQLAVSMIRHHRGRRRCPWCDHT